MKLANVCTAALLALLLVGCTSSQPVTTPAPTDNPETSASASTDSTSAAHSGSNTTTDTTAERPARPEEAPTDWFHFDRERRRIPGLATRSAYETVLADRSPRDTVTVAIIDSGIDIDHEDLAASTWTNRDEVPGNNKDDDNNGYVDDRHGWNFIGGPDGENVEQDTYELTRLYVKYRERFAGTDSASVADSNRDAYRRFKTLRKKFRQKRQQAQKQLQNVQKARDAVQFSEKVLSNHLGVNSLSRTTVDTLTTDDPQLQKARDILLYFYRQNLSPQDIYDYYDSLKRRVEYNYNSDFNPRPLVGDDYADKTERYYGNSDVEGPDPYHGTHVGGIVGAVRNNDVGIDGVARPVRVMPIRAVPNGDERDKDVANAIRYAVDNGADVINMSFGKGYSPHKEVVDDAIRYADSMDVLMVHAAGNDGANVDTTENYPTRTYLDGGRAQHWIEVGASSWEASPNLVAPFSNYGEESVDVFAPGRAIYSTVPDNQYEQSDGTSMAAPMVSGVAALIMAYFPELPVAQVRTIMLETVTPFPDTMVTRPGGSETVPFGQLSRTGGIVNAQAALQRAADLSTQ